MISREKLTESLSQLLFGNSQQPISNWLSDVDVSESSCRLVFAFPWPCKSQWEGLSQRISVALDDVIGHRDLSIEFTIAVPQLAIKAERPLVAGVKNILLVASGKGGVGKSTTTVNLALALQAEGARVGILDADIYGPSIPMMLGVAEGTRPRVQASKHFEPVIARGLQTMSLGYLTTDKTPAVWRGPMASGALMQILEQTLWDDLDYLVVDMPPGTGDIQLTVAQKIAVSGALIVTTPQDIALLDAKKAIEMFSKVNIPIVGLVENMSMHTCSACGHQEPIFGSNGGERLASTYDAELLAKLPLSLAIRQSGDAGERLFAESGPEQLAYQQLALRCGERVAMMPAASMPEFVSLDD
ncbi:MAG: iron-sulfur cluster carrier protein ApbC [Pseudomonadales bacterium]|jgi:ATP-binding protein involved in chromosome partitioning